jgi:drug/metabolite transporter (DMT)-like permease
MRYGMRSFHPAEFALGRYLTASVCLLAMTPWIRAPPPTRREWPMVLVLACSGISVYNLLLNFGISRMDTGPASFIHNSSALFAALFATALLGELPSLAIWLGISTSLCGILLIAHSESADGGLSPAAFLLLGSACCYALY